MADTELHPAQGHIPAWPLPGTREDTQYNLSLLGLLQKLGLRPPAPCGDMSAEGTAAGTLSPPAGPTLVDLVTTLEPAGPMLAVS